MNIKTILIVGLFAGLFGSYCSGAGEKDVLRVYLLREVIVENDSIELGMISVIRGEETRVAKAGEIGLGRFTLTGQQIVIDRQTILSRLASNGIKGDDVSLSGAERVTVKRDEKIIESRRFVDVARSFLKSRGGLESVSEITVLKKPKDWMLSGGGGEVNLAARMRGYGKKNKAKVWVAVVREGVELGGGEVVFSLKYKSRRLVALADIAPGSVISPDNTKIETIVGGYSEPTDWSAPYGMVAKRRIKKGAFISSGIVAAAEPPVVVKRRQVVSLKIERSGLSVSGLGEALSEGRVGESIRVKVTSMRGGSRIVVGKVQQDGTVEPVF